MSESTAGVLGLGVALPAHRLDQSRAATHAADRSAQNAKQRAVVERLYARSGIERRPVVLGEFVGDDDAPLLSRPSDANDPGPTTAARLARYRQHAPGLAERAGRAALDRAGVPPERVTHLVTASCTGFHAPNVDIALIDRLGLPRSTRRTHVGYMGCHAALNALRVADALARVEPDAVVLVVAVEVCSIHLAYGWDAQAMVSNALFGDAAAAAVVSTDRPADAPFTLIDQTSAVLPDTHDAMTWAITDHGFRMSLSNRVPDLIRGTLKPVVDEMLACHGLSVGKIDHWAIHPGGPNIITAVGDALALDDDDLASSRGVLRELGNLSSPTVLVLLDRIAEATTTGQRCVVLAFGPGLTIEAALLGCGGRAG
ncbi:MAG: type III polyketide synthase [Planctomycetota bacterium]